MKSRWLLQLGCVLLMGISVSSQVCAEDAGSTGGSSADLNSLLGPAPTKTSPSTSNEPAASAGSTSAPSSAAPAADGSAKAASVAADNSSRATAPKPEAGAAAATAGTTASDAVDSKPTSTTQAQQPAAQRRTVKSRITEEIVVTAERRSQNLQDVPASVSAFTGPTLDAKGLTDLKDLQNITPGLQYGAMATYSIIFIRGVGSDAYAVNANSAVATYLDGLYLPFTFSAAEALGDVERVEVLKGPQGSLYGRDAVGGAIVVDLKKPTKTFTASVLGQYGNYNDVKTKLAVSGPVPFTDQTLLYSLSYLYEDHKPYTKNGLGDLNVNGYHHFRNNDIRAVLEWDPVEGISLTGAYYNLKSQDADDVAEDIYVADPTLAALGVVTADQRPHYSSSSDNIGENGRVKIYQITAVQDVLPWFSTKFIYGHIEGFSTILFDYDSAPQPILDISALPNTELSNSYEMIFTSKPEGTPDWMEYVAGFSFANEVRTGRYPLTVDPIAIGLGVPLSGFFPNGVSPACAIYQSLGGDCTFNTDTNKNPLLQVPLAAGFKNKSLSAYAQFTLHATDNLDAIFGFRATHESEGLPFSTVTAKATLPGIDGVTNTVATSEIPAVSYTPQIQYDNAVTPTLGLNYHFTPDIMVYYKYSEGFLSANYNGLNVIQPPIAVKPEDVSTNEVGFKTSLLSDRSLKLNGAIFQNNATNAQVQTVSITSGGVTSLQNAGSYTTEGAELEATWFATEALVFNFSGTFLHGQYGKFIGRGFDTTTGINLANNFADFSNNTTVRTPKFTMTAGVDYTFPFFFGLTADAATDGYYNSGYFYDPANTFSQPSYYLINARFGLYDPRTNIRVTIYGKNLNQGVFFTNAFVNDFGDAVIYGRPRTFGIQVSWNYGS